MPLHFTGLGRAITEADVREYYTKYYKRNANQEEVNVWMQRPYSAEEAQVMIRDAGIADKLYTPAANEPVIDVPVPQTTGASTSGNINIAGLSVHPLLIAAVGVGVVWFAMREK